jgi:hypothetical protein
MFDELQNYDYGPRYLSSPPGRGPLGRAPIVRRAPSGLSSFKLMTPVGVFPLASVLSWLTSRVVTLT